MSEIWSVALTGTGLSACALSPDMARRQFSARFPFFREFGIRAVRPADVCRILADALLGLMHDADEPPIAVALSTPHQNTALFIDGSAFPIGNIYFDLPLPIPRHEIPEQYAADAGTAAAYRQSLLRRIRRSCPDFCLNFAPGQSTIGAFAAFLMTGSNTDACAPLGLPGSLSSVDECTHKALCKAIGINDALCPEKARAGHAFARISPDIAERLGAKALEKLSGVPIFHTGSSSGACAYACAADPLSWAAVLGYGFKICWTSGVSACAAYEITVIPQDGSTSKDDILPKTDGMTRDEWTYAWHNTHALDIHPGPRSALAGYGWHSPDARGRMIECAFDALPHSGKDRVEFDALRNAPLGSDGLHIITTPNGFHIAGLRTAHGDAHIARALFESMMYEIRALRAESKAASDAPLRLILDAPWPHDAAQWAADIICAPVMCLDTSPEENAAIGAAVALMRDLEIPSAAPHIPAEITEPSPRAAYYQAHYEIHRALKDALL